MFNQMDDNRPEGAAIVGTSQCSSISGSILNGTVAIDGMKTAIIVD